MTMEKIPSFAINHDDLLRGIYVSRKDYLGDQVVTTFDVRMKDISETVCLFTYRFC